MKKIILSLSMPIFLHLYLFAQELDTDRPTYRSNPISETITVDGELNERIWQKHPDLDEYFIVVTPNNGDTVPFNTQSWFAHDNENLYFAFYCYDDQPDKLISSISNRDDIWHDDWIGLNIDLTGNKRYGYVLVSNPLGIQADLYDSPDTGIDEATDFVWYSAGKITDRGYVVEFRLPLKNFNYKSGKDVITNIVFERYIARLGTISTWGAVPVGQSYFAGMNPLYYDELNYRLNAELIPGITYTSHAARTTPDTWSTNESKTEMGITGGLGITSRIRLEGTYNPDFSHVESDEFQVLANQRYPLFYSEKRPFFMEVGNIFNLATSNLGDQSMISQVHTRKIVDPQWGIKLNGEGNGFAFGILAASDEWPGGNDNIGLSGDSINPFGGMKATYEIGRIKYGLGNENHFGAIITNRNFAAGFNRVGGLDINYLFGKRKHWIKSNYLYSFSKDASNDHFSRGMSFDLFYQYQSRLFQAWFNCEYIGKEFEMATAFIRRSGIYKISGMGWYNLYPETRSNFLRTMTFVLFGNHISDLYTAQSDQTLKTGIQIKTERQGNLRIEYLFFKEYWMGLPYQGNYFNMYGGIQVGNWLRLNGSYKYGHKINYSPTNPYLGKGITFDLKMDFQFHSNISQSIQYQYYDLMNRTTEELAYDVSILISKTTLQINKYLFLRAIMQYDSFSETILTDALVSFNLIPGTVVQMGYGSQYEKIQWSDNRWNAEHYNREYFHTHRSLFMKVSYRYQFPKQKKQWGRSRQGSK